MQSPGGGSSSLRLIEWFTTAPPAPHHPAPDHAPHHSHSHTARRRRLTQTPGERSGGDGETNGHCYHRCPDADLRPRSADQLPSEPQDKEEIRGMGQAHQNWIHDRIHDRKRWWHGAPHEPTQGSAPREVKRLAILDSHEGLQAQGIRNVASGPFQGNQGVWTFPGSQS